ncbi:MAG: ATP-binding cassette domain-containing protein [Rhodobacteraceae bacterium]|nr:ATP-binding cassette domain-containing protein [Paracoccaceae bacterium]
MGKILIQVKNVWKIFGDRAEEALNAIQAQNLSKAEVLEQFNCVVGVANTSLDIREGEIFCIMGLSGSGKSTLVRHFNRLLEPTAGEIIIDGIDVMQLSTPQLQKFRNERIGMVFQNFALMPHRSVLDNVAMPLKFAHELSGGMQQRVGLARAISANPDVLLMDEPFSALDPLIRRQLQDEFIKLSKQLQKTTVFITHDLDEAVRIGDRIAIMKDGVVDQIGTAEEIVMNPQTEYVENFVAGISRLKVVKAHAIMKPNVADLSTDTPSVRNNKVNLDASLTEIIEISIQRPGDIYVVDAEKVVGVIEQSDILKTVIEGTETS